MPDIETYKLDHLQHEIEADLSYARRVRKFVSDYHWPLLGVAVVIGAAFGWFLKERNP